MFQDALGYSSLIRGYEYYIVKGYQIFVSNNSLKYELISPQVMTLDFVPLKKFRKVHYALYLDFYFDAGYVTQVKSVTTSNTFENTFLYGYGAGLNLSTYYDVLLRLEYSLTKKGDHGLFIHFETPF
jgi:hypothetical protein